jgi:hypothetical protein
MPWKWRYPKYLRRLCVMWIVAVLYHLTSSRVEAVTHTACTCWVLTSRVPQADQLWMKVSGCSGSGFYTQHTSYNLQHNMKTYSRMPQFRSASLYINTFQTRVCTNEYDRPHRATHSFDMVTVKHTVLPRNPLPVSLIHLLYLPTCCSLTDWPENKLVHLQSHLPTN